MFWSSHILIKSTTSLRLLLWNALFEPYCDLYLEANYQNGLLTGDSIDYSDGVKETQYTFEDGLPNGIKLVFGENRKDTIQSLVCVPPI